MPGFSGLYLGLAGCTWVWRAVPGFGGLYLGLAGCTWVWWAVPGFGGRGSGVARHLVDEVLLELVGHVRVVVAVGADAVLTLVVLQTPAAPKSEPEVTKSEPEVATQTNAGD